VDLRHRLAIVAAQHARSAVRSAGRHRPGRRHRQPHPRHPADRHLLALVVDEDPLLGVIALPQLDRTYWAADGLGACRDGHPIRITGPARLDEAIVAVGDYGTGPDAATRNATMLAIHAAFAPRAQRIRMLGAAAADLALLADSVLGASITLGNRTWDMAAGAGHRPRSRRPTHLSNTRPLWWRPPASFLTRRLPRHPNALERKSRTRCLLRPWRGSTG
jgi:hypothetical protein